MRKKLNVKAVLAALIISAIAFSGCSGSNIKFSENVEGDETGNGAYSLSINWPDQAGSDKSKIIPDGSNSISVSITGTGIPSESPITSCVSSGTTTMTVSNIPGGLKTALIKALDSSGNITAQRKECFIINNAQTTTAESVPLGIAVTGTEEDPVFSPTSISIRYGSKLYVQNWLKTDLTLTGLSDGDMTIPANSEGVSAQFDYPSDSRIITADQPIKVNGNGNGSVAVTMHYKAYISNYATGSTALSVIDHAYNGTISSGGSVNIGTVTFGVVAMPDNSYVYATDYANSMDASTIYRIDPADNSKTAVKNTGLTCIRGMAITKDGKKLYVASFYGNKIGILDLTTNVFTTPLTLAGGLNAITFTNDENYFYQTGYSEGQVYKVNAKTNTLAAATLNTGGGPGLPVLSKDEQYVYISNWDANYLSVIKTSDNTMTSIPLGSTQGQCALSPDGSKLYVSLKSGSSIAIIDTSANTVAGSMPTSASGPSQISISPDGKFLYVLYYTSGNRVDIIKLSDYSIQTLTTGYGFAWPNTVAFVRMPE